MINIHVSLAGTKNKPHGHKGILEPYTGLPIPFTVSPDQLKKLEKGEPVTFNERIGKSGRGVVIQDINATEPICISKITDLTAYKTMVPNVKNVEIYHKLKFTNGSTQTGAQFDVGALGLRFRYYLLLMHQPKYNTVSWTLDYKYNSDFDDNVGHWQVMPHPSKKGWSRVLYSTKVKLFSWIPEFIVNFLTGKALIESTTWLKKESELEAKRLRSLAHLNKNDALTWFTKGGATLKEKYALVRAKAEDEISSYRRKVSLVTLPKFSR